MLAAGVSLFVNRARMTQIFKDLTDSPGMIFMAGVMALALGIALVTFHNIWVADWRAFITVYGWIALVAGVVRIVFPDAAIGMGKWMMERQILITVSGVLNILIGGFLTYMGFLA